MEIKAKPSKSNNKKNSSLIIHHLSLSKRSSLFIRSLFIVHLSLFLTLVSCKKDPTPDPSPTNTINFQEGIFISNEGTFNWGNASLSFYDSVKDSLYNNLFQSINGRPIGDVFQSIYEKGDYLYLIVNNSQTIEVIHKSTLESVATIETPHKGRYLQAVNDSIAYLTNIFSDDITIINLSNHSVLGSIPSECPHDDPYLCGNEQMVLLNNTLYVINRSNDQLWAIHPEDHSIISEITVGKNPVNLLADKNGHLWILCDGLFGADYPSLYQIDPSTNPPNILKNLVFPNINDFPSRLSINTTGEKLYFLNEVVYQLDINDNSLPSFPIISANGGSLYGLGITQDHLYISDALDFTQNGIIYQYNLADYSLTKEFKAGIIPNGFWESN